MTSPAEHAARGRDALQRMIADECIATDEDVEVLRRVLEIYEAVTPLVDPTHSVSQLEWNSVLSRLRRAVAVFESGSV